MELRWTEHARDDLLGIWRHIARDDPDAASAWVDRLRARARQAARLPKSGRIVPEFDRDEIREILLRSYRIVYRIAERAVEVLTVFEGHRLLLPDDIDE